MNEIGRNFSGWKGDDWQAAYLGLPYWSFQSKSFMTTLTNLTFHIQLICLLFMGNEKSKSQNRKETSADQKKKLLNPIYKINKN